MGNGDLWRHDTNSTVRSPAKPGNPPRSPGDLVAVRSEGGVVVTLESDDLAGQGIHLTILCGDKRFIRDPAGPLRTFQRTA